MTHAVNPPVAAPLPRRSVGFPGAPEPFDAPVRALLEINFGTGANPLHLSVTKGYIGVTQ